MRRVFLLLAVLLLGIALGALLRGIPLGNPRTPDVESTFTLNDPAYEKFVITHVKAVRWRAEPPTANTFRTNSDTVLPAAIVLEAARPTVLPDDHGSITLTLIGVADDDAQVGYVSQFDHRSFGKALVTVHSGIVRIPITRTID